LCAPFCETLMFWVGCCWCRVPSQADMQAVDTAVTTLSASTGSWGTSITGISGAVTYMANLQTPANNPFTSEGQAL
jgi:hypothetical protein